MTLGQERAEVSGLIHAHNSHVGALNSSRTAHMSLGAQIKSTTKDFFANGAAMKSAKAAMMPMTMLIPMITDESKTMSAMM